MSALLVVFLFIAIAIGMVFAIIYNIQVRLDLERKIIELESKINSLKRRM